MYVNKFILLSLYVTQILHFRHLRLRLSYNILLVL